VVRLAEANQPGDADDLAKRWPRMGMTMTVNACCGLTSNPICAAKGRPPKLGEAIGRRPAVWEAWVCTGLKSFRQEGALDFFN